MNEFWAYICAWIAGLILIGTGLSIVYLIMGFIKVWVVPIMTVQL